MKFTTAQASDLKGAGFLDQPGTYHLLIDNVKVGLNSKDEPLDGTTIELTALSGTVSGQEQKKCNVTLWDIDQSKDIEDQKQTVNRWTNFFLAANLLRPDQLGTEVDIDPVNASGHQVVIKLGHKQKQVNGKWVDDTESKFLVIAYADIFHVDDPEVSSVPLNKDALGIIAKENRHTSDWFDYKKGKKASASSSSESTSNYDDDEEF